MIRGPAAQEPLQQACLWVGGSSIPQLPPPSAGKAHGQNERSLQWPSPKLKGVFEWQREAPFSFVPSPGLEAASGHFLWVCTNVPTGSEPFFT